jgi:SSS family solute:Na+ symporter
VVISAPAVVLSVDARAGACTLTCLLLALPTAFYTMFGGVQAVAWTDVKQMVLIVFGLLAAVVMLVLGLPDGIGLGDALSLAGTTGRMQTFDFSFRPYREVHVLVGHHRGLLPVLLVLRHRSEPGAALPDGQVGGRSADVAAHERLLEDSAAGARAHRRRVPDFVFYMFTPPPLALQRRCTRRQCVRAPRAADYEATEAKFATAYDARKQAATSLAEARRSGDTQRVAQAAAEFTSRDAEVVGIRKEATTIVREASGDRSFSDVNYVFPTFVMTHLPVGLVGLIIAAIFAAAMSTISAELASLSTATVIDFYRRYAKTEADDAHYLRVSKIATGAWGLFACIVAIYAAEIGSLIEVVNRFGSFFYGSILGVFLLAVGFSRATANGAFVGLIAGMGTVAYVAFNTNIAFLWHNVVGVVAVLVVGGLVSLVDPAGRREARA